MKLMQQYRFVKTMDRLGDSPIVKLMSWIVGGPEREIARGPREDMQSIQRMWEKKEEAQIWVMHIEKDGVVTSIRTIRNADINGASRVAAAHREFVDTGDFTNRVGLARHGETAADIRWSSLF